jgi:putative DNA primase/helicase
LVGIPVGGHYGVFDDLHSFQNGREFSESLVAASKKTYGVAGREFLSQLVDCNYDFLNEQIKIEQRFAINSLSSQVARVAKRFALIAHAGELATKFNITCWTAGDATSAAINCFNLWFENFHSESFENDRALQSVSDFVDKWRDSRFLGVSDSCVNRAGYIRIKDSITHYQFNRPGLQEALNGMNFKRGLEALKSSGWLLTEQGSLTTQVKIKGKNTRLYVIHFPDK